MSQIPCPLRPKSMRELIVSPQELLHWPTIPTPSHQSREGHCGWCDYKSIRMGLRLVVAATQVPVVEAAVAAVIVEAVIAEAVVSGVVQRHRQPHAR